ncbi:MAG: hypothetical protein ACHP8A_21175 [Terriglobales bacterium]|nr:hypothetical protein [Pirellulales bacterium]
MAPFDALGWDRDFLGNAAMFTGSSSLFGAFSFNRSSCLLYAVLGQFIGHEGEAMRTEKRNP